MQLLYMPFNGDITPVNPVPPPPEAFFQLPDWQKLIFYANPVGLTKTNNWSCLNSGLSYRASAVLIGANNSAFSVITGYSCTSATSVHGSIRAFR